MSCKFKDFKIQNNGTVCTVPYCKITDGECQFLSEEQLCELSVAFCDLNI